MLIASDNKFHELSACGIVNPIVYGLLDCRDSVVVYIGKTKNPKKRFEIYRNIKNCHNKLLKEWLKKTGSYVRFVVLEDNPQDILVAESALIKQHKDQLLNQVIDDVVIYGTGGMPWQAKTGVHCPSSVLIRKLMTPCRYSGYKGKIKAKVDKIKKARDRMTVQQRVNFEVDLAMKFWDSNKEEFERWIKLVGEKLITVLESQNRNVTGYGKV